MDHKQVLIAILVFMALSLIIFQSFACTAGFVTSATIYAFVSYIDDTKISEYDDVRNKIKELNDKFTYQQIGKR